MIHNSSLNRIFIRPTNVIQLLMCYSSVVRWQKDPNCFRSFCLQATPLSIIKWRWGDSNPWPPPCKGGALPTKLHPQVLLEWAFQDSDLRPRPYQRRALTNWAKGPWASLSNSKVTGSCKTLFIGLYNLLTTLLFHRYRAIPSFTRYWIFISLK